MILDIIRPLLGDRVGRGDDFFDMGGNSLIAMKVVAAIHTSFGVRLPVRAVFDARTPEAMAAMVDGLVAEWNGHRSVNGRIPIAPAICPCRLRNSRCGCTTASRRHRVRS